MTEGSVGAFAARATVQNRFSRSPSTEARVLALGLDRLYDLFLLNLVLQLFDGMATYSGIHLGMDEANQLLCNSFAMWGIGPSLILFKACACGTLLLLYRNTTEEVARPALTFLAAVYVTFSFVPWMAKLMAAVLPVL